ncbi:MAG: hypothetical protein LH472_16570 [Pyrinomonadaceae bacterium]|nr:hypothetical protein [Pyrinomonadaceae bacterium]
MKNKRTIVITGLIGISLIIIGLFVYINFFFGKYIKEIVLESDFLITSDGKEINIKNLVKIEKDINYISILLEPSDETITFNGGGGIRIPSGEIVNPEIKLLDEDGKEYLLAYGGSRHYGNNEYANYRYQVDLPVDKKYEKVLIRSDIPIKSQKIIWSGYNAKDLK